MSNYHALQMKLEKRFSRGLSFLVAYTWSKTLTNAESQFSEFSGFTENPYNRKAEKSVSINDYPHNLVINYGYDLPFGPGKKFVQGGGTAGRSWGDGKSRGFSSIRVALPASSLREHILALWPYEGQQFHGPSQHSPWRQQKVSRSCSQVISIPTRILMFNPEACWIRLHLPSVTSHGLGGLRGLPISTKIFRSSSAPA